MFGKYLKSLYISDGRGLDNTRAVYYMCGRTSLGSKSEELREIEERKRVYNILPEDEIERKDVSHCFSKEEIFS